MRFFRLIAVLVIIVALSMGGYALMERLGFIEAKELVIKSWGDPVHQATTLA